MQQVATITSKKQLTLPSKLFKKVGFKIGQKVMIRESEGKLIIASGEKLVDELAGSVPIPKRWQGKDPNWMIDKAKEEYLSKKFKAK
jgi:bifunctional DNA-binding transcriptional regulator/antitoxin component of YhaV-PrlF toxin-antitoxin module